MLINPKTIDGRMNKNFSILRLKVDAADEVTVISYGNGCYAFRGNLEERHDYTRDYVNAAELIADIITGKALWITTDPRDE